MKRTRRLAAALVRSALAQSTLVTSTFVTGALACCATAQADSPEYDEEIVVTADLRGQTLQEIPTSVSIVTSEDAAAHGAQHIEEVLSQIANVNYASGTSRARYYQIRGIGERSQFIDPLNSSVGFLVDNVDFSGAGSIGTLFDVQQVEVLRGPQGTRYGANGLAGLIHVKTREPTDEFEGLVSLAGGNYGQRGVGAVLSGAMSDAVHARLAVQSAAGDGFVTNDHLGRDDTNDRDETTLRARMHWLISDDATVKFSYMHVDVDNGYDAFSLDNTRHTLSDQPGHDRQDSDALGIDATWLFDDMRLQLIGALSDSDVEYGYDEDWAFDGIHPFGYTSSDNYLRDRATRSLEARLSRDDGDFSWVAGLYSLAVDEDLLRQYTFAAGDYRSDHEISTVAAFAQVEFEISANAALLVGGRLEQRDADFDDSNGVAFSPDETLWGGRIALTFAPSDSWDGYVSLARGYKAGGFNTDGSLDADLREFDSEDLIELEAGIKGRAGALGYQIAVFYDRRRDQQVKSSIVRVRADGTSEFIDFNGNAAKGTNKGVEVSVDWQVTERLEFFGALGLLDAGFDRFINEFGEDLSGRAQAHAPDHTANFGGRYRVGEWAFQLDASLKDEYFYSDRHHVDSNSDYTLLNGSVHWQRGNVGVRIWGRNLTDEDFAVRAFGSFGNDPRKDYVTEPYFQWGEPRVVGATVTLGF